ncbi:bZIP transcription factor 44-like [Silene latifolia]|uniref:bZIP transcription factor 44-like n=1 Tax=Silene latifolia TaxID=37657 RepID=UPI003D786D33
MATSSNSSSMNQNSNSSSSSEEEMMQQVHQIVDERKRKRMQSNRESARRSRIRKQKHLDDLSLQVENLKKSNNQILNNINVTNQEFIRIESENSILRAQMLELSNRLESLNEINEVLGTNNHDYVGNNHGLGIYGDGIMNINQGHFGHDNVGLMMNNPWSMNQPIMASADMFQY